MKLRCLLSIVLGVLLQLALAAPKPVENEARKATDRLVFAHFMVFPLTLSIGWIADSDRSGLSAIATAQQIMTMI